MKLNRNGYVNTTAMVSVLMSALFIIALIFAIWAFSSRQHYKNDANNLVNQAVAKAKAAQETADNQRFAAEEQSSLTTYNGPSDYGSISLQYPKTWSAFIDTTGNGNGSYPLDAYFLPNYLTSVTDDGTTDFALRMQIENESYNQVLQQYDQASGVTVSPYALPKVPNDVGVEISGQINNSGSNISGTETLVILPLRSQALEIWTEGSSYLGDFSNVILPNLSFSP